MTDHSCSPPELDPATILNRLRSTADAVARRGACGNGHGDSLIEAMQTPRQREILDRLSCVMTLVEGHGDYVMDAVGPQVVPTVEEIRARFNARRAGASRVEQTIRRILGIDLKMKQYAQGSRFVDTVVREAGMDVFNRVWTSPETLPVKDELAEPHLWLERVERQRRCPGRCSAAVELGGWALSRRSRRSAPASAGSWPSSPRMTWCWPPARAVPTPWPWRPRWPTKRPAPGSGRVASPWTTGCSRARRNAPRRWPGYWPGSASDPVERVPCACRVRRVMGARRRRRAPRGTRLWTRPRAGPGRKPCSSPTAATIRRRASCSAWPGAPVRQVAVWHAVPPRALPAAVVAAQPGHAPRLLRGAWACGPGTTRTTVTPPMPGRGSATRRCPRWRRPSARGSPRRWPAPCQPDPRRCRGAGRSRRQPGRAGPRRRRCLAGRPAGRGLSARDQDPGAAPGRHRQRLPARRADRTAHRASGQPDHLLARATVDGPARRYPGHPPLWQAAFRHR